MPGPQASASGGGPATGTTGTLGTFGGVFTPSILTILGIILFLRLGYVVGAAGLARALLIIVLANTISILTSISLAAIATNLRVKGGGDYYLISRTLGVQYGGALGLVLFLAQSVSVAFYAVGFGEAVAAMLGLRGGWAPQVVAAVAVTGLFAFAWLGADWATRLQYLIMAVLFSAILVFFIGSVRSWDFALLRDNWSPGGDLPFWAIFAIFFPAVTGFTQGVSMSGDLKNPGKSLPLGTFLAVGLSLVVYLAVAVLFGASVPGSELAGDYGVMRRVSGLPWLVDAGVIAATLSSALASFLGAPRILQSLAGDRVFPILDVFAKGHGRANNPRRGVVLTALIAFATIAVGGLNLIAPVVSMFFLISYGLLNYATYFEAKGNSPSFRPRFRFFDARLSLVGSVGCLAAMLAIQPVAGAVAVVLLFAIHQYVSRRATVERWADSDRSRRFQRVRDDLHAIAADLEHPRYWRPVLLAFSEDAERRTRLLRFASWLEGRSGLTTAVRILETAELPDRRHRQEMEKAFRAEIEKGGAPAFARVVVTRDLDDAIPVVLQAHGLGTVRPNTVLLNWFDDPTAPGEASLRAYGRYLRIALRFGCNVVILGAGPEDFATVDETPSKNRRIDVWYRENATGRLMLLLAYLTTRNNEWHDATIRLLAPARRDLGPEGTRTEVEAMLKNVRIDADIEIVETTDVESASRVSAGSSLVFAPFRLGQDGPTGVQGGPLDHLVRETGVTALVLAAEDIALDSEPEEGVHAEIAQALDEEKRSRRIADQASEEAEDAEGRLEDVQRELEEARGSGADDEAIAGLEAKLLKAEKEAERLRRRAARAHAKSDSAAQHLAALTGQSGPEDETPDPS